MIQYATSIQRRKITPRCSCAQPWTGELKRDTNYLKKHTRDDNKQKSTDNALAHAKRRIPSSDRIVQMGPSKCIERERIIAVERSAKCWGTASVNIDVLEFPNETDEENVDKLAALFTSDFRGLNPRYHIPAKIDKDHLDAALTLSGLTIQELKASPDPEKGYPELRFPPSFRLKCFAGLHRAKAAAEVLPPGARRWSIDLYDSSMILLLPGTPVWY